LQARTRKSTRCSRNSSKACCRNKDARLFDAGALEHFSRAAPGPSPTATRVASPICEGEFRRSLVISGDDYSIFPDRPISATILSINAAIILWMLLPPATKTQLRRAIGLGMVKASE
jgi:hypothetical protein